LLDPIKQAYNQSWLDGRLKLTASASDRLWISMLAVLVTVPTVVQNSLHPLSTSSIIARHLVDFLVWVKITEADTNPVISPFLCQMPSAATFPIYPGLGQAPNNAFLHTQWLG